MELFKMPCFEMLCIQMRVFETGLAVKGIYHRLTLIKCYLLDMDLALYALLLLSKVKFNKSWIYFIIMGNGFY